MRVVFMGSPEFAVPALRGLIDHHEVIMVVTQPDKPSGRGKKLTAPPVKTVAEAAGICVLQPRSARRPEFAAALRDTGAEVGIVVAYGKILPVEVLTAFPRGCLNIHGSILPRYRGAAPIQRALLAGDRETGVSIMQLDEGMDTGPVLLVKTLAITDVDTSGSLFNRMAPLGAEALLEALEGLRLGELVAQAQDHAQATHAPMLTKEDGRIDWTLPARTVSCRIRGVDPWPGAQTRWDDKVLKVFGAREVDGRAEPGAILAIDMAGVTVACGDGAVLLEAIQAPGKQRTPATDFARGYRLQVGQRFRPFD